MFLFIWRNVRVSKLFYFSLQNIIKERVLTIMTKYIFVTVAWFLLSERDCRGIFGTIIKNRGLKVTIQNSIHILMWIRGQ